MKIQVFETTKNCENSFQKKTIEVNPTGYAPPLDSTTNLVMTPG